MAIKLPKSFFDCPSTKSALKVTGSAGPKRKSSPHKICCSNSASPRTAVNAVNGAFDSLRGSINVLKKTFRVNFGRENKITFLFSEKNVIKLNDGIAILPLLGNLERQFAGNFAGPAWETGDRNWDIRGEIIYFKTWTLCLVIGTAVAAREPLSACDSTALQGTSGIARFWSAGVSCEIVRAIPLAITPPLRVCSAGGA